MQLSKYIIRLFIFIIAVSFVFFSPYFSTKTAGNGASTAYAASCDGLPRDQTDPVTDRGCFNKLDSCDDQKCIDQANKDNCGNWALLSTSVCAVDAPMPVVAIICGAVNRDVAIRACEAKLECDQSQIDRYEAAGGKSRPCDPGQWHPPNTGPESVKWMMTNKQMYRFKTPNETNNSFGSGTKTIDEYLVSVTNGASIILGGLALLKIIFGGIMYATAAGNPQQISEAKGHIQYALIGILLILGMQTLLVFLGLESSNPFG